MGRDKWTKETGRSKGITEAAVGKLRRSVLNVAKPVYFKRKVNNQLGRPMSCSDTIRITFHKS